MNYRVVSEIRGELRSSDFKDESRLAKMFLYFFEVHDICVLMVQVKEVDLVRKQAPIKTALLDNNGMKPVRAGINHTGANAATGRLPAYD